MTARSINIPVITIDGPTASGKGTIAHRVAQALGWAVLDSGALYRLTALAAQQRGVDLEDELAVAQVAQGLDVTFQADQVRSEEHTSELQSLMRISYAVFCLKKKKKN